MRRKRQYNYGKGQTYAWLVQYKDWNAEGCLIWPFFRDPIVGRGRMGHEGKQGWAHRFMCELVNGPPPTPKHHAAHNCGKGHLGCVHPKHLEWKIPVENYRDKIKHGTNKGGRGYTKLTPEAIADIQSHRLTQQQYMELYGLSLGGVQYWWRLNRGAIRKKSRKLAA